MKKWIVFLLPALMLVQFAFAQINKADSTVQVIGYWDKNEKQSYSITVNKYRVSGTDTSHRKSSSYEVAVTIVDSTANSYTIEWEYDYTAFLGDSIPQPVKDAIPQLKIIIKTDEMGAFKEVVNWKELRDYWVNMLDVSLAQVRQTPEAKKILNETLKLFSTKEAIEGVGIKDILQFYTFHGGNYKLGEELTDTQQLPNFMGGKPFEAEVTVLLDDIDFEDDNSILRISTVVDPEQLTKATFDLLKSTAAKTGLPPPDTSDLPFLKNETQIASVIHGSSGWVIYSFLTKEVSISGVVTVEERIIELK